MLEKIQETAAFLKAKMQTHPETAIILGTGLGSLVHEITDKYESWAGKTSWRCKDVSTSTKAIRCNK